MCNLRDKKSKKEAKIKYITSKPHIVNSKYSFQVKDRQFKIKKYIIPTVTTTAAQASAQASAAAATTTVQQTTDGSTADQQTTDATV